MTQVTAAPSFASETAPESQNTRSPRNVGFAHVRALLVLNALYFGVAALAAGYAFINPALQSELNPGGR